jgi:uroporphyrinogen decarboxylase
VETPDDWKDMRRRYRVDDPTRVAMEKDMEAVRAAVAGGAMTSAWLVGMYAALRGWMGMERLSYAFYDHPEMIHDMVATWAELCATQIERLPADIPIDQVSWWEDMAGRNGPLVSPRQFTEFLTPGYQRVMEAARRRGCVLAHVDCDGNPHDIVRNWLDVGVNVMFPLEVQAGVDPIAWRKEFGKDCRFRGGIGKEPLVQGGKAIDRELERIRPLLEDGGFVPHLDHLVPPDIPYAHYLEYLEKKRRLIGR